MAQKLLDNKDRNLRLTRLLSYWTLINDLTKGLKHFGSQLKALDAIEVQAVELEKSVRTFCEISRSDDLLMKENLLERVKKMRDFVHAQIKETTSLRQVWDANSLINIIFRSYEDNSGHDWAAGWYLFEFSKSFERPDGKTSWEQMHSYLKDNKIYISQILKNHFDKATLKQRVARYIVFCKKNKLPPTQKFFVND